MEERKKKTKLTMTKVLSVCYGLHKYKKIIENGGWLVFISFHDSGMLKTFSTFYYRQKLYNRKIAAVKVTFIMLTTMSLRILLCGWGIWG